ncbi:MAG: amidohydrolase family protein, partial [Rikenellaceae bacterium]
MTNCVEGRIIDIENREIFCGSIHIENGVIKAINKHDTDKESYILPGFIDAHVHIESSMLTPENFGNAAIKHGTVAVVTDPHEIANVLGVQGIEFMVENSKNSPVKTFFTVPSCVPATPFDVSGAVVSKEDVEKLFSSGKFVGLSEMMNVPGVIFHDDDVISKIEIAKKYNLPIDGHAPLLRGDDLSVYVKSGMSTDHECVTLEEAHEKISLGMKVIIREGSAALNYETLKPLISESPNDVMFCTDDSHPHEILSAGHIKKLVVRSICNGFDLYDVLKVASINPINHYNLDVGRLRVGDKADFIVVDNIIDFNVQEVYINGEEQLAIERVVSDVETVNNFTHDYISVEMLKKAVS